MYEIERKDNQVIIRKRGHAVYSAPLESWIVYQDGPDQEVAQVKNLTDEKLLRALVNAIEIKESSD